MEIDTFIIISASFPLINWIVIKYLCKIFKLIPKQTIIQQGYILYQRKKNRMIFKKVDFSILSLSKYIIILL